MKNLAVVLLMVLASSTLLTGQTLHVPSGEIGTSGNGNVGIGTQLPEAKLEIKSSGNQLKLSGGNVDAGVWTNGLDMLYLADWNTATKGLNINMSSGNIGISTTAATDARLEIKNTNGNQLKLSGGTVDAGVWTSTLDVLYLADWSTATKGLNINLTTGNVGIGTSTTGTCKLAVEGKIGAREVNVLATGWPDYVFENNYNLPTLTELEAYIKVNKHLPEVPSACAVEDSGINLGEMNSVLLKKLEELTLYMIEQNKKIESLTKEMDSIKKR